MDEYYLAILQGAFALYILLLGLAAVWDLWKFVIPNVLTVTVGCLFLPTAVLLPLEVNWLSHVGAAAAVFLGGAAAYRFGVLGAGDVKLMTAVSLWAGFDYLPAYGFYVALCGGALAVSLLTMRRALLSLMVYQPSLGNVALPRLFLPGENIPYGVAIAAGSIILGNELPHLGLFL